MEIAWSEVMGEMVTQTLKILVPLFVALVIKWAGELWIKIKESLPSVAYILEMAAQIGYASAEEHFKDAKVEGKKKLDYAIERAEQYLKENGVTVDLNVVKDAIIAYGVENELFTWQHNDELEVKDGTDSGSNSNS